MRTSTKTTENRFGNQVSKILATGGLTFVLLLLLTLSNAVLAQESIWGMTAYGGSSDYGVIYKTDLNGQNQEIVHEWTATEFDAEGLSPRTPMNGLVSGNNGNLYGTTLFGGDNQTGVIFSINEATNEYTELASLSFLSEPGIGLHYQTTNGTMYGMTSFGGSNGIGSIFSLSAVEGEYSELYSWTDVSTGQKPEGNSAYHNGQIIGTTLYGGVNDAGTLFKFDIASGALTVLKHFDYETIGMAPFFQFEIINNVIYGMTRGGGDNGYGTIYSYNLSNDEFNVLHHFNSEDGEGGRSFTKVSNNLLIGNTIRGGANGKGVLFTYNIATATYTKKVDFDWVNNGAYPETKLLPVGNNKFLGFTRGGGENGNGVNYTYNLATNALTVNFSFTGANGSQPAFNNLIKSDEVIDISIIRQPMGVITCEGQSFVLEIEATPTPASLAYQWYKNQNAIAGATNPRLDITDAEVSDAGAYHCAVWNPNIGDGIPTIVTSEMAIVQITEGIHVEIEEETCNPFDVGTETYEYTSYYGCDSIVTVTKVAAYVNADFSEDIDGATVTFTNESENADNYFWSFGDGTTSTEANPVHEYPGTGFYMVFLIAMRDGCVLDFQINFIFVFDSERTTTYGISERLINFQEEVKAFPNPTRGPVTLSTEISFPQNSQFDLTVMDMYGKVVHSEMMNSMNHKFDLSYLAPATYLVKVAVDGKSFEQKIVVSH